MEPTAATIRPDGTIAMPLVGDLKAAGRTTRELQTEIKRKVQAYVVGATVTVAVTQVNSYSFAVAGQVARPGLFRAQSYVTVNEAIAMAGGPTRFADAPSSISRRAPNFASGSFTPTRIRMSSRSCTDERIASESRRSRRRDTGQATM